MRSLHRWRLEGQPRYLSELAVEGHLLAGEQRHQQAQALIGARPTFGDGHAACRELEGRFAAHPDTKLKPSAGHPIQSGRLLCGQGDLESTEPTKMLMRIAEKIDHGDNPVLTWMASNLSVQTDKNENRMPTKKHSRGRIDGMTALIMAIGRSLGEDDGTSVYESRGVLLI